MCKMLTVLMIVLSLSFLAAAPVQARRGADDPAGDDRGGGSGGGGADDNGGLRRGWINETRARALLTRVEGASDADAYGFVEIRSDRLRERFRIVVERLDAGATVSATIGDGAGGVVDLGTAVANLVGEAKWDYDTKAGDVLPGGVTAVADLSGRPVAVADSGALALLEGTVPEFGSPSSRRAYIARARNGEAELELRMQARIANVYRLMLRLGGLEAGAAYTFWIEEPAGSGEMVQMREFLSDSRGRVRARLSFENLSGRAFQIRNRAGDIVFSGQFPTR